MYPVSEAFSRVVRASHRVAIRVDVVRNGVVVLRDLPISGGSVQVDSGSDVRRSFDLTVADPSLNPLSDKAGTLSPYNTWLAIYRGAVVGWGEPTMVPLGVFRVDSLKVSARGEISLSGPDRTKVMQDSVFLTPTSLTAASTVPVAIRDVVRQALGQSQGFTDRSGWTGQVGASTWDGSRWEAAVSLATAIGCRLFFDADGNAVLAKPAAITDPIDYWIDAGEGGVLIEGSAETTRERTYNYVRVNGESVDGATPVSVVVQDTDIYSPTWVGGPFGLVPLTVTSSLVRDTVQATAMATGILAQTRSLNRQLSLSAVPNPALDVEDVIGVRWPSGEVERHIVDKVTIPLDADSAMSVDTRSSVPTYT